MNKSIKFICNNEEITAVVHPALSLLDFLRKKLKLTGTKEGCKEGDCGACTILLGEIVGDSLLYKNVNSCLLPMKDVEGKHIVTIEGLNSDVLSPIQESFISETASQCGFCTPGFIISFTSFLLNADNLNFDNAINSVAGNICRCTGHIAIKRAISSVIDKVNPGLNENRIEYLVTNNYLPNYFLNIYDRLCNFEKQIPNTKKQNNSKYLVSGGTDLFVQKWEDLVQSNVNFFQSELSGAKIQVSENQIIINASTTISEFKESEIIKKYFNSFIKKINLFGSLPIRNRATIGGNIVNASPIADMTSFLLAAGSLLMIRNDNSNRIIQLKELFKGYKSLNLLKEEIIESIIIPIPDTNTKINYEKVSKRNFLDIASVNTSIFIRVENDIVEEIRISAGGVAPIPLLLAKTSNYLYKKELSLETINEAFEYTYNEISPISDARGSADYKKLLLKQLIISHFITLFPNKFSFEEFI